VNMLFSTKLATARLAVSKRSFSTKAPIIPRIVDRRNDETGPGGRGSDAGLKVAVFGASGFLGRYVCSHLGTYSHTQKHLKASPCNFHQYCIIIVLCIIEKDKDFNFQRETNRDY